jgi:hypothetical protein
MVLGDVEIFRFNGMHSLLHYSVVFNLKACAPQENEWNELSIEKNRRIYKSKCMDKVSEYDFLVNHWNSEYSKEQSV